MQKFTHTGVLIPRKYEGRGFHILVKGRKINLTPEQEEMAVAWVKKLGTAYVEDPVFIRNFFQDFCKALGIRRKISPEDFDFSPVIKQVEKEKAYKLSLSKEEKKRLAAERKAIREKNKEKYGFCIVDGSEVELGNYTVEPSSIFMGRGDHPLRGRWKRGANRSDIILNLSPDAPKPLGEWKEISWHSDYMWIAKWDDKLRGKEKYVWLADSSPLKQQKDIEKFDKAIELGKSQRVIL